ncbi:helix-turn-helix domain-containing protein [Nocardia salmonicida]|uniref:helix-turn-helix domain-containing protein n=1 Tax=Nocardia salmonicida TaxID=53431 RepID=UPI003627FB74
MVDVDAVQTPAQWRAALKALTQRKRLTYYALEERGIARATLSNILTGKSESPRWSTVEKILRAFDLADEQLPVWESAYQHAFAQGVGVWLSDDLDPFELGVHKSITVDHHSNVEEILTTYVPRPHDVRMAEIVDAAASGRSAMVVLVGDSSTGKTRALWEAVSRLRDLGKWRLWHPTTPNRRTALDELERVRPRTVVWLNETQEYLGGDNRAGNEDAAVALRGLVRDPARAPVLVVGTLWRSYYRELRRPHASQTRDLLEATAAVIKVPSTFADADPNVLAAASAADPRLEMARARSEDGQISQYLAGGPELVRRYEFELSPSARAIVQIAMDARRMGHRNRIPLGVLADAAHAYMNSSDWNRIGAAKDWLERALADTAQPSKGADGPLTMIVPTPARSRMKASALSGRELDKDTAPVYQLADYLDQYGRIHRQDRFPPIPFWEAVAAHAGPQDLRKVGEAAWDRGLYRDAAQLWRNAAQHGDGFSAGWLLIRLPTVFPETESLPEWALDRLSIDDAADVGWLLGWLKDLGLINEATMLANRAVVETRLDGTLNVAVLLEELQELGLADQAVVIAKRAATDSTFDDVHAALLLRLFRQLGLTEQAISIASQLTADCSLDNPEYVGVLVEELADLGLIKQVTAIADRTLTETSLENWLGVRVLLESLAGAGLTDHAVAVANRATTDTQIDEAGQVAFFLGALYQLKLTGQAIAIADRATTETRLDDAKRAVELLDTLRNLGFTEQAMVIADRASVEVMIRRFGDFSLLSNALESMGLTDQVVTVLNRTNLQVMFDDAAELGTLASAFGHHGHVRLRVAFADLAANTACLDEPYHVASLLDSLRNLGLTEQARRVADRAVNETILKRLHGTAALLDSLRKLNLTEQANIIAGRAITQAANERVGISELLTSMRNLGLHEQVVAFTEQLPTAGMFAEFREHVENPETFRFGREPDGSPAAAWRWSDLE